MIVFGWRGFPQYAARCVGAFVKVSKEPVVVVGPRPMVPVEGMERVCGCPVYWTDRVHDFSSQVDAFGPGDVSTLIVSGWGIPALDDLRKKVRAAGGRVVMTSDYRHAFGLKGLLMNIRFRLLFRAQFDRFFVPGKSGRKLMRSWGIADDLIEEGLYSADASLFTPGPPLSERARKIICVAQFVGWKNGPRLMRAFARALEGPGGECAKGWSLELYGSGPLKGALERLADSLNVGLAHRQAQIRVHPFLQPEELAAKYREARFFCLPSESENWGLVVHEGALSGCGLLLSRNVGSADDLLAEGENGWSFDPFDVDDMAQVLRRAMEADDATLSAVRAASLRMAQHASLERFSESAGRLVR